MSTPDSNKKDFASLEASGLHEGTSFAIGIAFVIARQWVAKQLVRIGVTPNGLTVAGFGFTVAAAACLAFGASDLFGPSSQAGYGYWCVWAGAMIIFASACDMLDGAVARVGGCGTAFGGVLDSTMDRFSDVVIYIAIAGHFAWRGNLTYTVLPMVALVHTFMISYVKARAEDIIDDCSVGWWQRGERHVSLLITCFTSHIPLLLWHQAVLPAFTVWRRLDYTRQVLKAQEAGTPPPRKGPLPGAAGLIQPWRYPRGSLPFDLVAAVSIVLLIVGPWVWPFLYGRNDPLRRLVDWLVGT